MRNELMTNESLDAGLNLKLRKNTLLKDGSLFAKVSTKTATVKSTLTLIKNDGTVSDTSLMLHYLEIYQKKLIQLLEQGYAVKVLDLGVLRIRHKGKIENASDAGAVSNFTLGFSPSKIALDSVKELSVDTVTQTDSSPVIESVTDVFRNEADGFVTASQPVRLSGAKLKIGNDLGKLYFVPQAEAGGELVDSEKSDWIEVERSKIFRDKPSELIFFAPASLAAGVRYKIRIETSYLAGGNYRAVALCGESGVVQLKE